MTRKELPARAANIQRAVASTTTCTPATVESLRSFFLQAEAPALQSKKEPVREPPPKGRATPAPSVKAAVARARKQPAVAVLEVPGEGENGIQAHEKSVLATEVVNATLKALSEAIKHPPAQRKRTPLTRSSSNVSVNIKLESRSQTPLQALSANRAADSPGKQSHSRRSSSSVSVPERIVGLRAQAECGRMAFATLRSLQLQKGSPQIPYLQLETGMSALVARLITLGFEDLALRELRILRRRLEASKCQETTKKISARGDKPESKTETMADMLKFENIRTPGPLLALIITTQLQALKILALKGEGAVVEAALQHLRLDVPHSPANLIQQHMVLESPNSQDKAAHQLESLAQTLIALCPSPSPAEDKKNSKSFSSLPPQTAFKFQLLAFQVRSVCWSISSHQINLAADMIGPFSRCIAAFHRRSKMDKMAKYEFAMSAFQFVTDYVHTITGFGEEMLLAVYQVLADLAQESSQYSEAIRWVQKTRKCAKASGASLTSLCTLDCRLATLRLKKPNSDHSEDLLDALKVVAISLTGNLQGEPAELDQLLIAVASLRRSAFFTFQEAHRSPRLDQSQASCFLFEKCLDIVLLCARFLGRYVGSCSRRDDNEKTAVRREQRRRIVVQIAPSVIESVVAMARLTAKASLNVWVKIDAGLRDCLGLGLILDDPDLEGRQMLSEEKRLSSPFISISNAYWFRYLHLKQEMADTKACKKCLQASVDAIKDRPSWEKLAGSLSTKFEKYGHLYETIRDYKNATEAYQQAINTNIDVGLLWTAAEAAATRSIPDALDDDVELGSLSRTLLAYSRAAFKATDQGFYAKPFYDADRLRDSERGLLLEQQLIVTLSVIYDQGPVPTYCQSLNDLAKLLLSLYTTRLYPVRRIRVMVRLLGFILTNPNILEDGLRDQLHQDCSDVLTGAHSDTGLLQFLPHLTISREILLNLSQKIIDVQGVEAVMASWSTLLQHHPDWGSLRTQVYDITDWLVQLESMAERLEMQGLGLCRVSVLHVLVAIHEAATSKQCSTLVAKLSALGLQYVRLGYSGAAGVTLRKAQRYLEASDQPAKITLQWYLIAAENSIANDNFRGCKEALSKAKELFDKQVAGEQAQSVRSRDKSEHSRMVADAYYIHSLLAAAEGRFSMALFLARLSVKSCQKAWAIVERSRARNDRTMHEDKVDGGNETLVDKISELSISENRTAESIAMPYSALQGAAFWSLVPRLFRGLIHLTLLFAQYGLVLEARYYLYQAQKIAQAINAPSLIGQCFTLLGQFSISGGDLVAGLPMLEKAENTLSKIPHDLAYVSLQLFVASHHTKYGQPQDTLSACTVAQKTLEKLLAKSFLDSLAYKNSASENLETKLSALTLYEVKPAKQPQAKAQQIILKKRPWSKPLAQRDIIKSQPEEIPAIEAIKLNHMKGEVLRVQISAAMSEGDLELAASRLGEVATYPCDQQGVVLQTLLASRVLCRQGLEKLVTDPVFCVIPESTISCPSVRISVDQQQRQNTSHNPQKASNSTSSRAQPGKRLAKKMRPRSPSLFQPEPDLLILAQSGVCDILPLARKVSSTTTLHEITGVLGRILMMLSATSSSASRHPVSPAFVVYILETGRMLSMVREARAIKVEQRLLQAKTPHWPGVDALDDYESPRSYPSFDFASFQAEYIDIIPSTWTAISMTLSESREEIFVSKIHAGQSPFVLRLPLSRPNSLESDEESFGFDQGKAELQDIILLTNKSTHGAQDLSNKRAKTEWWEARTALDARLQDLLINIESIWLGGFKGIFSPNLQDRGLLARFQQSLHNILDRHLPSRQKSGRGNQGGRVTLDQRIHELFVGLGNPSESNDVDEPLKDLLYFVVDILQFNGERNAYDEVDFDSIAIETIDALRQYHQAINDKAASDKEQHTILILDKHLHCFPWESLPCLSDHAVSRLPSLGCLRDRIVQQRKRQGRQDSSSSTEDKIYVKRSSGASVLNPAGDLKATQAQFEEPLQELPGWETIIQREPTESEMKIFLESHDIFLYFGHGSGEQYIRSRIIKRLDKCAVALLMGCSSGALTEAGEFEPYGTPMDYMHASSPAMLATLWDVTDKDIDRFAHTVLEKWGLLEKGRPPLSSSPVKKSAKQKGKSKAKNLEEVNLGSESPVSLDEAVARGRDSCILKYLNGAAPIVYGVPVFLE